jgi:hypothetical protein
VAWELPVQPKKPCPSCNHHERATIDQALAIGQAPRSIVRRYAGISRKAIARHRDECLKARAA